MGSHLSSSRRPVRSAACPVLMLCESLPIAVQRLSTGARFSTKSQYDLDLHAIPVQWPDRIDTPRTVGTYMN